MELSTLIVNKYVSLWQVLNNYHAIVDEARPLSGFFPTHADLFTEVHL